jgi:hypothetical protein
MATTCQAGLGCVSGLPDDKCGTCGGMNQPCCGGGDNGTCTTGLGCSGRAMGVPGMCGPCGATGQACCGGGGATQCGAGNRCNATNMCVACGAMGQACCPGGGLQACRAGLFCSGPANNAASVCGTTPPATPDAAVGQ